MLNSYEKKFIDEYYENKSETYDILNDKELFNKNPEFYTVNLFKKLVDLNIIKKHDNIFLLHKLINQDKKYMSSVYPYKHLYMKNNKKGGFHKHFYDKIFYCDDITIDLLELCDKDKIDIFNIRIMINNQNLDVRVKIYLLYNFKEVIDWNYYYYYTLDFLTYIDILLYPSIKNYYFSYSPHVTKEQIIKEIDEDNKYIFRYIFRNKNIDINYVLDLLENYDKHDIIRKEYKYFLRSGLSHDNYKRLYNILEKYNINLIRVIDSSTLFYIEHINYKGIEEYIDLVYNYFSKLNYRSYIHLKNSNFQDLFDNPENIVKLNEMKKLYPAYYYPIFYRNSIDEEILIKNKDYFIEQKDKKLYDILKRNYNIREEVLDELFIGKVGYYEKTESIPIYKFGIGRCERIKFNNILKHLDKHIHKFIFRNKINEELITKACSPKRMYNWNEYACEEFPDEYIKECERYK